MVKPLRFVPEGARANKLRACSAENHATELRVVHVPERLHQKAKRFPATCGTAIYDNISRRTKEFRLRARLGADLADFRHC